ncbi:MAG TPA: 5-(carboxyamino)imidazole ribonucleotide mutase [Candidatus Paceibacterota bacterium]|nr:5-(carboxyamino)imidazole ribonucleotide mutase [Candidatus Paceibacterota bacterium]
MKTPLVGIIMGSDSDLPVMQEAVNILNEYKVENEVTIVSAHRTPDRLVEYAESAEGRGIKLIIAGAGGAAHLPGMTAAMTNLPVIGVPIKSKSLDGVDSLLSIMQMPFGVPVATVAINGAKNAGLLALKILALSDESLQHKLDQFMKNQNQEVKEKAKKMEEMGSEKYLNEMK